MVGVERFDVGVGFGRCVGRVFMAIYNNADMSAERIAFVEYMSDR